MTATTTRTIPATQELATWSKRLLLTLCQDHGVTNLPLGASNGTLVKVLAKHRDARGLRPAEPTVTPAELAAEEQAASGMSTRQLVELELAEGTLRSMGIACKLAGLTGVDTTSGGAMNKALTAWLAGKPADKATGAPKADKGSVQGKHGTAPDTGRVTPEVVQPNAQTASVDKVADPVRDGNGSVKCYVQSTSNTGVFGVASALQCLAGAFNLATNLTDLDMLLDYAGKAHAEHKARLTVKPAPVPVVVKKPAPVAQKTVAAPVATVLTPVVVSPVKITPPAAPTVNTDLPTGPISYDAARALGVDLLRLLGTRLGLNVAQYIGKGFAAKLASAVSKASKGLEVKPVATVAAKQVDAPKATIHTAGTVLVADGKGGLAVATLAQRLAGLNPDEVLAFLVSGSK